MRKYGASIVSLVALIGISYFVIKRKVKFIVDGARHEI
jgi:hypothetical protein